MRRLTIARKGPKLQILGPKRDERRRKPSAVDRADQEQSQRQNQEHNCHDEHKPSFKHTLLQCDIAMQHSIDHRRVNRFRRFLTHCKKVLARAIERFTFEVRT